MISNRVAKALVAVLSLLLCLPALGGAFVPQGKYVLSRVRVSAEGKWHYATKKTTGEFVVWVKPNWPATLPLETTWTVVPWPGGLPNKCNELSPETLQEITLSLSDKPQPGHPKKDYGSFVYVFQNFPRGPETQVHARCQRYVSPENYIAQGVGKIRFEAFDPLADWDPGLPPPGIVEISKPSEGEAIPSTEPLSVYVKSKTPYPYPNKLGLEIEAATQVQTGVVGDLALPKDKPYVTQWTAVRTIWVDVSWQGPPYNYATILQVPGYLTTSKTERYGHHQAGYYHLRVLTQSQPPSQWRNFQVKGPIVFKKLP